jgi:hypothetical protein
MSTTTEDTRDLRSPAGLDFAVAEQSNSSPGDSGKRLDAAECSELPGWRSNSPGVRPMNAKQPDEITADVTPSSFVPEPPSIWCVVANITREPHPEGTDHGMRLGTRYFAPGAKVYCSLSRWGDGGERLIVYGRHRAGRRLIRVVMSSKLLTNFRAKQVFDPKVVALVGNYPCDDPIRAKAEAIRMAESFQGRPGRSPRGIDDAPPG